MTIIKPDLPVIPFASRGAWEAWLEAHHATSDGLWLKITKKGSGLERVSVKSPLRSPCATGGSTARRIASTTSIGCFGSPRAGRRASVQGNRGKVRKLIEEGRMKPAGLREVERAKAEGRWEQ
jgi:uncharacterized protein YdeI (YjbR/CyaY-like superfamily)